MDGRRGRCAGWLLGLLAVVCTAQAAAAPPAADWQGTVTHVSDGDTLWVRPQSGGAPRAIRLDGIDAPERCQCHGEAARVALEGHVLGQRVQVQVRRRDAYGRALARVRLQGQDVGSWLVRQGHAWSYRYRGHHGPYAAQEMQARDQGRGVFQVPGAQRPRDFRQRHGPCQ